MAVTLNDVEYVAKLARLSFSEDEKEQLTHQLNDILKYMEQLNSLDTTNVEPL
ncbi:Asp-tRNA(Asn)/Glu-tRNA(Gln) amidotransferase subunit GatC, partial [Sphingobacteriales bacterium CHB3]|nr:Asp-tRNA(Asn)/Glu-tRNA(Gln) amidotransferase subunit GatC [Sphingobacteriales bacterium CHB3]